MRRTSLLITAVLAAGCGSEASDRTPELVRCLERHGGVRITRLSELDRFPSSDPQYGTGYSLESIAFDSIDVAVGDGDVRRSLVFVSHPGSEGTRSYAASDGLRRARSGQEGASVMIAMPASVEFDEALTDCAEEVAREEIYP